ncbi:MAG: TRAP transporter substrate-binding protein [Deltaproteobacteria bacterium]|nr:TRAP transporter substrate-binding protein [Deltaproteobacteria bacterium]
MCKVRNLKMLISMVLVGVFMIVGLNVYPVFAAETLRLSNPQQQDTPVGRLFDHFKAVVERETKGELKIDVFSAGVLGSEIEATEQLFMNQIDIACISTPNYSGKANTYLVLDLPYVFSSHDEWRYQMGGYKDKGGELLAEMREYAYRKEGVMLLAVQAPATPKVIGNSKRFVKTPADTKGIKIRVSPSPIEAALVKNWGFIPVPVPWPETYSAMAQKVVDGAATGYLVGGQFGHFDILKYSLEPEAVQSAYVILVNGKKWASLSPEFQQILLRAAAEGSQQCWGEIEQINNEWREKALKKGVQAYVPTGDVMAQWYNLAMEVWPEYLPKMDQEVRGMVEKHKNLYQEYLKTKK